MVIAGNRETYRLHRSTVNCNRVELITLEAWFGSFFLVCPEAPQAIWVYMLADSVEAGLLCYVWLGGQGLSFVPMFMEKLNVLFFEFG